MQVFAGGLLSAFGHSPTIAIRDFSGDAQVNPDDIQHSSLKITIKAESLAVRDDISDKDQAGDRARHATRHSRDRDLPRDRL